MTGQSGKGWEVLVGDSRDVVGSLPENHYQCVVTSPPYFALREYGDSPAELGKEYTPKEFVAALVDFFTAGVRRVLRDDGLLFVNIADTFASKTKGSGGVSERQSTNAGSFFAAPSRRDFGVPDGSLALIPERFVVGMQDAGWLVRQAVIWHVTNRMPTSVKDRFQHKYEHVFMFAKRRPYKFHLLYVRGSGKIHFSRPGVPDEKLFCEKAIMGDVWPMAKEDGRGAVDGHHARYPEWLPSRCIECSTDPGDAVLDPFVGTGTTLTAAIKLGRRVTGVELYPKYADVASASAVDTVVAVKSDGRARSLEEWGIAVVPAPDAGEVDDESGATPSEDGGDMS